MKNLIAFCFLAISFNSFAWGPMVSDSASYSEIEDLEQILDQAELTSTTEGRAVLETARAMINNQEIILGSCWDYIDAIYKNAGHPTRQRKTIFKSKLAGPHVAMDQIEGGDWPYFVNHSYGGSEHSGIFVAWVDEENKEALMISYVGGGQARPARYKKYDLSSVYNIIRAVR